MRIVCLVIMMSVLNDLFAQNPILQTQFSADPTARVFNGKLYLYPSHDILATEGRGRVGWFCMEDYHVFSSEDLTHWADHGVILSQDKVPWVRPDSYSMWAPDCIYRNGKYYFYFPSAPADTSYGRGFTIGVAISDKPEGPFVPQTRPIGGVHGIDPNVFIDKNGQAYLYWAQGNFYVAKLKENMTELASPPVVLQELPTKGLKEGPFLFERNGTYFLTYPHVRNKTECLEYATGDNPMGPFIVKGVLMDESPTGCWTNHQSIVEYKGQWYLFYHHNDLSPRFDKARSVRVDSMFFESDGTIRKVIPTLRGVGITRATEFIDPDRYSAISAGGAAIAFLDTLDHFRGWKTILAASGAWVRYNSVDFGKRKLDSANLRVTSGEGGVLEVRVDGLAGPVIAEVSMDSLGNGWRIVTVPLQRFLPGVHHLFLVSKDQRRVEVDWIRFE